MNKSPIYDPAKRRCVVHEVLKDFLSADIQMKALWILEDKYAKQHSLPILEYIDQIEQLSALGEAKKALRERLTKELYFSEKIGEDPWNEMLRYKRMEKTHVQKIPPVTAADNDIPKVGPTEHETNPATTDQSRQTAPDEKSTADNGVPVLSDVVSTELIVFTKLLAELNKLFTNTVKDQIKLFYSNMLAASSQINISPEAEANMVAWCQNNGNVIFNDIFTINEMTKVIHSAYMWAVEYLGPEDADAIFSQAVTEVKRSPEANEFSPTNFL